MSHCAMTVTPITASEAWSLSSSTMIPPLLWLGLITFAFVGTIISVSLFLKWQQSQISFSNHCIGGNCPTAAHIDPQFLTSTHHHSFHHQSSSQTTAMQSPRRIPIQRPPPIQSSHPSRSVSLGPHSRHSAAPVLPHSVSHSVYPSVTPFSFPSGLNPTANPVAFTPNAASSINDSFSFLPPSTPTMAAVSNVSVPSLGPMALTQSAPIVQTTPMANGVHFGYPSTRSRSESSIQTFHGFSDFETSNCSNTVNAVNAINGCNGLNGTGFIGFNQFAPTPKVSTSPNHPNASKVSKVSNASPTCGSPCGSPGQSPCGSPSPGSPSRQSSPPSTMPSSPQNGKMKPLEHVQVLLDWDDTLFPTSFTVHCMEIGKKSSDDLNVAEQQLLEELRSAVMTLLVEFIALFGGHNVAIVTNATLKWVVSESSQMYRGLFQDVNALLRVHNIPVISATDSYGSINPKSLAFMDVLKGKRAISNVISVGDSTDEFEAVHSVCSVFRSASEGSPRRRKIHYYRCKLMERPSLKQMVMQIASLRTFNFHRIAQLQKDRTFLFN